jgi:hypothetical protein
MELWLYGVLVRMEVVAEGRGYWTPSNTHGVASLYASYVFPLELVPVHILGCYIPNVLV